ncbi:MAG: signal peptidase I [Actinomycetia bacterium]|nr:signal peptidase I [Actinomycetes bacterium]
MSAKRKVSVMRHVADVLILGVTAAAAWFLWPAFLGGTSRMITVQGHSMEPTYVTGDLVVLDAGATPAIGKIIVFKIPDDEPGAGLLVVHRVIGIREDGTYITQGDNTQSADTFLVTRSDILGSPRFSIPHGGQAIGLVSSPIGLALATGSLCTALLWPRKRDEDADASEESESAGEPLELVGPDDSFDAPSSVAFADESSAPQVDEIDFVAEAEAWLRNELALLGRSID